MITTTKSHGGTKQSFAVPAGRILCVLGAISVTLVGCGTLRQTKQDDRVTIYEHLPSLPTGNDYEVLEVRGKRYSHLFSYGLRLRSRVGRDCLRYATGGFPCHTPLCPG